MASPTKTMNLIWIREDPYPTEVPEEWRDKAEYLEAQLRGLQERGYYGLTEELVWRMSCLSDELLQSTSSGPKDPGMIETPAEDLPKSDAEWLDWEFGYLPEDERPKAMEEYLNAALLVPNKLTSMVHAHEGGCGVVLFNPRFPGCSIVTGGQDKMVKVWDSSLSCSLSVIDLPGSVLDLCINRDGSSLAAACGGSKDLYFWPLSDLLEHGLVRTFSGHQADVCAVASASSCLASAAYDGTIKVWDWKGCCSFTSPEDKKSICKAIRLGDRGRAINSGHDDGKYRLWDVEKKECLVTVQAHSTAITSLSFDDSEGLLLTSAQDNSHKLIDVRSGEVVRTLEAATGKRMASDGGSRSCICPSGRYVAAGFEDGSIHIWDTSNGRIVRTLSGKNTSPVLCCSFQDNWVLAASHKDGSVCLWEESL